MFLCVHKVCLLFALQLFLKTTFSTLYEFTKALVHSFQAYNRNKKISETRGEASFQSRLPTRRQNLLHQCRECCTRPPLQQQWISSGCCSSWALLQPDGSNTIQHNPNAQAIVGTSVAKIKKFTWYWNRRNIKDKSIHFGLFRWKCLCSSEERI